VGAWDAPKPPATSFRGFPAPATAPDLERSTFRGRARKPWGQAGDALEPPPSSPTRAAHLDVPGADLEDQAGAPLTPTRSVAFHPAAGVFLLNLFTCETGNFRGPISSTRFRSLPLGWLYESKANR